MARVAGRLPIQFGRERPTADSGAIRLGDAQHVMQHAWPHARARRRVARDAIAGSDIGVGAVIDIQQRALRTFKQQIRACCMRVVQLARDICHHGFEHLGVTHGICKHRIELNSRRFQELRQHEVVQLQQHAKLGGKFVGVSQILYAQGASGDFVFIGRANAFAGCANLFAAALLAHAFAGDIECRMKRQNQWASLAHP